MNTTMQRFNVALRAEVRGNVLRGHAAVFGQITDKTGEGWYEQFDAGAFDKAILRNETAALWNHDPNFLLGRQSSGTLRLGSDSEGLEFELDLPDTSIGRDLRVLAERGDLTGASVGFLPGEDRWDRAPDGVRLRSHTSVAFLRDVSPVAFPAYDGTAVAMRSAVFSGANTRRSQLIRARARVHLKGASL